MLELKEMTDKDSKNYMDYDANLVFQYRVKVMLMRFAIENYGVQEVLEKEVPENDKGEKPVVLKSVSLEERAEIYKFIERNPKYTDDQVAKVLFRESEFYPR